MEGSVTKRQSQSGTLKSMGLQAWLDEYYYRRGGWEAFVSFMESDPRPSNLDQLVADVFGRSRQAAREWRLLYEADRAGAPQINQEVK